jgi:hypothetical protein
VISPIILPVPPIPPIKLQPVTPPEPPKKPITMKRTPLPKQEAVLVSGLAFPRHRGEKIRDVFSNYCATMAERLNTKYPGIKITVFNFYEGAQMLYEFSGAVLKTTVVKSLGKLNVDNYRYVKLDGYRRVFVTRRADADPEYSEVYYLIGISDVFGSADVKEADYIKAVNAKKITEKSISIGDVYDYIEKIGRDYSHRLVEFHIFSRADTDGGPKLVGSHWYTPKTSEKFGAKYIEKDGHGIDFDHFPSYKDAINDPDDFKNATIHDTITVNWGSALGVNAKSEILYVMNSPYYKEMLKDPYKKLLPWGWGVMFSLDDLSTYWYENHVKPNYSYQLAHSLRGKCYGAAPGTDANLDDEHTQRKHGIPLMHIFMGKDYDDPPTVDYRILLKFYKEVMHADFYTVDAEYHKTYGRGYIKFFPLF